MNFNLDHDKVDTDQRTGQLVVIRRVKITDLPLLGKVEVNLGKRHIYFTDDYGYHYYCTQAEVLNFPQ